MKFVRFQYMLANQVNTTDPSPIWRRLPEYILDSLTKESLDETITFHISAEGEIVKIASSKFKDQVTKALFNLKFNPALKDGDPVSGTVKMKISDLMY